MGALWVNQLKLHAVAHLNANQWSLIRYEYQVWPDVRLRCGPNSHKSSPNCSQSICYYIVFKIAKKSLSILATFVRIFCKERTFKYRTIWSHWPRSNSLPIVQDSSHLFVPCLVSQYKMHQKNQLKDLKLIDGSRVNFARINHSIVHRCLIPLISA